MSTPQSEVVKDTDAAGLSAIQKEAEEAENLIVKAIEKLNIDYTTSLDDLGDAESESQATENAMYALFMSNDSDEKEKTYKEFVKNKLAILQKQSVVLRVLQRLKQKETKYLIQVINARNSQLQEMTAAAKAPSTAPSAEPPIETITTPAASSSRGRLAK